MIIIPKKAFLTVVAASVRFANTRILKDDWLEVNGVFIGEKKGDDIIVHESYPIMHQKLDKSAVIDTYEWSQEDSITYTLIDDEAFSKGLYTVGAWHSHPGFKIMMSHIDIKHLLFHQSANPSYFSLVFNHERLIRQVELPEKKGDPLKQLKNDPGFKIFRLDSVASGIEASYHEIDYKIEGFESIDQLINLTQKFIIDITNFFPKINVPETYEKFVVGKIKEFDSLLMGTEEYLTTLTHRGEKKRIPEVLKTQTEEIRKFVAETYIKIENIKEFMDYLEFKERETIIPKVESILHKWDELVSGLDKKLKALSKKF